MFRKNKLSDVMNVFGPVDQARRCLDRWLKEQGRRMRKQDRQKLSGLMARYFENEDQVTDQLMMSFLNHYIGARDFNIDDPVSVRMEIKELLDKSISGNGILPQVSSWPLVLMAGFGILSVLAISVVIGWQVITWPMTMAQQIQLKNTVEQLAEAQGHKTTAVVWNRVKKPLNVRRYQDITYWQFDEALAELNRIAAETPKP